MSLKEPIASRKTEGADKLRKLRVVAVVKHSVVVPTAVHLYNVIHIDPIPPVQTLWRPVRRFPHPRRTAHGSVLR